MTDSSLTKSAELFERAKKVAPGGVHSPVRSFKSVGGTPVFFEHAEGAMLRSVDGVEYVDFCQSFGPLILGHRDPEVAEAVQKMLGRAWSLGACEPFSLELAEWITSRLPFVEVVRFVSSGTEAVMSALRVARGFTGRKKILKFDGCYHGHVDSMLVKAGSGLAGEAAEDSAGIPNPTDTLVAPLGDARALERIFEAQGREIAAVILEPLPANYGLLIQEDSYIRRVVEIARAHGALVIFDEVISGFRVHPQGMAGLLGIEPDLCTYGKVVGGGFPLGCFGGKRKYMEFVAPAGPVYQAGTLSANPVSVTAGLATLRKVERDGVIEQLNERCARFVAELDGEFRKAGLPWQAIGKGSLFWIHGQTDRPIRALGDIPKSHRELFPKFFHHALAKGIYLAPSAFEVGFLSLAHKDSILERAIRAIVDSAKEIRG